MVEGLGCSAPCQPKLYQTNFLEEVFNTRQLSLLSFIKNFVSSHLRSSASTGSSTYVLSWRNQAFLSFVAQIGNLGREIINLSLFRQKTDIRYHLQRELYPSLMRFGNAEQGSALMGPDTIQAF